MSKRVHVLQHVWFEGPGWIAQWARERGYEMSISCAADGDELPAAAEFDFLIILGGPMSVHDQLGWLERERALMREVLVTEKPLLGICLGGQLLTQVLGGEVYRAPAKEIGWFDVSFERSTYFDFEKLMTLHWHGEAFGLPEGASLLGRSKLTPTQGYVYGGNKVALQFHPEMDLPAVQIQVKECGHEIGESASTEILARAPEFCESQKNAVYTLLDRLMLGGSRRPGSRESHPKT